MAEFKPFRGIRYNAEFINDHSKVIAPPYDVISPAERDGFYESHPYNVIRLILGKPLPDDNERSNVYARAARFLTRWRHDQVLRQDSTAGFYLTSVSFDLFGQRVTRYGIIGKVRLEPFDQGVVLPHERTFSKVKSERLRLMQACHANLCPIFGLYRDANGTSAKLRATTASLAPTVELTDDNGLEHRLWQLTDKRLIVEVTETLKNQKIYIADGHHRYETALNYRDWVKESDTEFTTDHPCNYVMMSLISMEDPGLVILPAHRLLSEVSQASMDRLFAQAPQYFDIHTITIREDMDDAAEKARALLKANQDKNTVGVYARAQNQIQVMVLKPGVMQQYFKSEMHAALLDLDVSVLTRLMMMELLGFDQQRLDDETKIAYCTEVKDAMAAVRGETADLCFMLNPTKMKQVQEVAEQGLIMPRKSTYFYPKEISGLVMNTLKPSPTANDNQSSPIGAGSW